MARTQNQILRDTTLQYLSGINPANPPDPTTIESDLLQQIAFEFDGVNATKPKGAQKWKPPERLCAAQIALIIAKLYPVAAIPCAGIDSDTSYDVLGIYQPDGDNKGVYATDEDTFRVLARKFNFTLSIRDFAEMMQVLREYVPRKLICNDPDLIALNNGIFNYKTKTLMPFSQDYVFLAKSRVDFVPNTPKPVLQNPDGTTWDIDTWMDELSDDPEIVDLLWHILGAIIRPNVDWNKSAWLYSTTGNNGKGTLCTLMRNLVGARSYACIPLANFSKDFMLEPLLHATAIIVDENDVGGYIDQAGNLKSVITNDVIQINRKYKTPISFQFRGFMVQCLNEMPRIRDKSDSIYRRQLFVPMSKCFTGVERTYIKRDYLYRTDVLQYILYKLMTIIPDYYKLPEPAACKAILTDYKEFNDPVRQFVDEIFPQLQWDLLPYSFLYDLYKAWMHDNAPNGGIQGKTTFINDLVSVVAYLPDWMAPGRRVQIRPRNMMAKPEPLILQYNLTKWMNPVSSSKNPNNKCVPVLMPHYRGLLRTTASAAINLDGQDSDDSTDTGGIVTTTSTNTDDDTS